MLVFEEKGAPEYSEKNLSGQKKTNIKLNPYMAPTPEFAWTEAALLGSQCSILDPLKLQMREPPSIKTRSQILIRMIIYTIGFHSRSKTLEPQ